VVHGFSAVATATDRSVITYFFPSREPKLSLIIPEFQFEKSWSFAQLETLLPAREANRECLLAQAENADSELICQVFLLFLSRFGFPLKGGVFVSSFRVPVAAGMGSSASFGVSLLGVLLKSRFPNEDESELISLLQEWSYASEMLCHGKPSGIDNTVALRGGTVDFKTKNDWKMISEAPSFPLLVINLNVPKKTKEIIQRVTSLRSNAPEVVNDIFATMGRISTKVIESLSSGRFDRELIILLFRINHGLLHSLALAHPKACQAEAICAEFNVFPKITGAGFGGCLISIVPDDFSLGELRNALKQIEADCFIVKTNQSGVRWMENIDNSDG